MAAIVIGALLLSHAPILAADNPSVRTVGHWKLRCWRGKEARSAGVETCNAINAGVGAVLLSRMPTGIGVMIQRTPCPTTFSGQSVPIVINLNAVDRAVRVNAAIRREVAKAMAACARPWPLVLTKAEMIRLLDATDNLKKLR